MVKAENGIKAAKTDPQRSSKSEYFSGKFQQAILISSHKSSQRQASSKPSKRYVVLDDMTILEVTSDRRQEGLDTFSGRNAKKNPPKSLDN